VIEDPAPPSSDGPRRGLLPVVGVAVASVVAFRVGLLPGGLVGVWVGLAALGWWCGAVLVASGSARRAFRLGWRRTWPPALVAVLVSLVWVLVTSSTARDRQLRGEVLGLVGGYSNWHQLLNGPAETSATRLVLPLQHLWALAIAAQAVALWALLAGASRRWAARRTDGRSPMVALCTAVGVTGVGLAFGATVLGGSGQQLLLASWSGGAAFFLGAAVGSAPSGPGTETVHAIARGTTLLAGVFLAALAVFGSPSSMVWRSGGSVVAPALAVIVVVAAVPSHVGPTDAPRSSEAMRWSALVAFWVLHVPALALLSPPRTSLPQVAADLAGLVVAAALAAGVAVWVGAMAQTERALERRRVLVPPAVAVVVVAVLSATGAFHWSAPQSRAAAVVDAGVPS
jgi:peptidoglycan/LPS O-acetylase OafA/YrhL